MFKTFIYILLFTAAVVSYSEAALQACLNTCYANELPIQNVGRLGKKGPPGAPGPAGPTGLTGTCACDIAGIVLNEEKSP